MTGMRAGRVEEQARPAQLGNRADATKARRLNAAMSVAREVERELRAL